MKPDLKKYSPIILIIVLVVFHRLSTIPNTRFLPSDSGNIASFAEGLNSTGNIFEKDEILNDKKIYNWYTPAYIFLIRSLSNLFGGNYYIAFWCQIDILMFLFLLGCYLFGRDFIGGKKYGILFMLINLIFIKIPMGGGWGISNLAPRPTTLFVSILPLLLWVFWKWKDKKNKRYAFFFILGLTFYIHPASAPYWIASLWLSSWFIAEKDSGLKEKIIFQFKYILILITTMMPYIIIYTNRYQEMDMGYLSFSKLLDIFKFRINRYFFKPFKFPIVIWENFPLYLKILTILSVFIIIFFLVKKGINRKKYSIISTWIIALLFVSSVLPFVDLKVSLWMKRFPYQIDLARNYLFLPFLVYIIFFLFLKNLEDIFSGKNYLKKIISYSSVLIVIILLSVFYIPEKVSPVVRAWTNGKLYEESGIKSNNIGEVLLKVNTSPGDSIFHFPGGTDSLYIRYSVRRALVYTFKDGGVLLYSGKQRKLLNWYQTALKVRKFERKLKRIKSGNANSNITNKIVSLARSLNADFLLVSDKYKNINFSFGKLKTIKYKGHVLVDLSQNIKAGLINLEPQFR